ncbi:MAG: sodium-translocating pyrophosphatase [Chloroflexota bacterium]|nr:sodium-translocating pyrophosphatase [Chloroflexota bacterium]MDE3194288.1 sodium-translocating pyrophosphatase [Chloroflexota bacterium]
MLDTPLTWIVPVSGLIALLTAAYFAYDVLHSPTGTKEMQDVAGAIYTAAVAFIKRQYRTIALLAIGAAVVIAAVVYFFETPPAGVTAGELAIRTAIAFLVGATASMLSGIIGMFVAVKSNLRTGAAAQTSLGNALRISLRGGAVSGILVVALSLIGVFVMFTAYNGFAHPDQAPFLIVGFGFGASFVALFAQLGGGIYTKAADLGADLVGKVEAGIPEDDPRNAAVVADLVGDNVGDCAGRGADLFESTAAENIGAMILGVIIFNATHNPAWILFPLIVRGFGIVASVVGIFLVRGREEGDPMNSLNTGFYVTTALNIVFMWLATNTLLNEQGTGYWFFLAGLVGILTSQAFVYITRYYTSGGWRPVKEIAEASRTGAATVIISGTAVGYETTAPSIITISLALFLSYFFGNSTGLPNGGVYGTAVATMGMLMSAAFILAMDTFGPITDNAAGVVTMAGATEEIRHRMDRLDAAGNTTKALTKGYAVASAALAAFLLFSAYLDRIGELKHEPSPAPLSHTVNLAHVDVFLGGLLGAMLVYLFSSLAIRAVGRAGSAIIEEVRTQFREHPGIMAGTEKPDYARVVDITTASALRNMIAPGLLAVGAPIVVGVLLKSQAEAAFLMVGTMAGVILATVLNNGGGAWDNAKKYIELGELKGADGKVIGKGTPEHAAAVVGDTVGDPFKDTAGPSLHVLVKLLSTITLVLAPLFI